MAATFVRRVEAEGRVAWRKTYADGGARRRIAALRWVARRLGANALLAPIPLQPAQACLTEQAMIRRLAALGAHVPTILHVGENELLLDDLGPTLSQTCRDETNPEAREALVAALREGIWALLAPVVVLGGIYGGAFTPTEAAVAACVYALVVGLLIERRLRWRDLPGIVSRAMSISAVVMAVVAVSSGMARVNRPDVLHATDAPSIINTPVR